MRTHRVTTILALLTLVNACAVIDVDFEKNEADRISQLKDAQADPFKYEPTPEYVKLAEEDDVLVEAFKVKPINGPKGLKLEVWEVNAINKADIPQCVTINWKLQDFEFESELPYKFLINKHSTLKVGKMRQTVWSFDDAMIAIPPSGYVDSVWVTEAEYEEKTKKFICDTSDKDIEEPEETDAIEL